MQIFVAMTVTEIPTSIAFMTTVLALCSACFFAGFRMGRSSSVPEPIAQQYKKHGEEVSEFKDAYKGLSERFAARVSSLSTLVHSLQAKRACMNDEEASDLKKIASAVDSFNDLFNRGETLQKMTPTHEISASDLVSRTPIDRPLSDTTVTEDFESSKRRRENART
jgi:hypothetical protein